MGKDIKYLNVQNIRRLSNSLGKRISKEALIELDRGIEMRIYRAKRNAGGQKTIIGVDVILAK